MHVRLETDRSCRPTLQPKDTAHHRMRWAHKGRPPKHTQANHHTKGEKILCAPFWPLSHALTSAKVSVGVSMGPLLLAVTDRVLLLMWFSVCSPTAVILLRCVEVDDAPAPVVVSVAVHSFSTSRVTSSSTAVRW